MRTEEEARKSWCPFQTRQYTVGTHPPTAVTDQSARCRGGDCMAWTWEIEDETKRDLEGRLNGWCGRTL